MTGGLAHGDTEWLEWSDHWRTVGVVFTQLAGVARASGLREGAVIYLTPTVANLPHRLTFFVSET
jgi:hypothetical protein